MLATGRLIPARAGNTGRVILSEYNNPAHPRSRGEHFPCASDAHLLFGSSPLARGTPPGRGRGLNFFRLIPARAGNTLV